MGLSSKVGSFNIDTAVTAGNTQAVTGVGFTPKVVIFWWSGTTQTSDGARGEDYSVGFGAMSGASNRGCVLTSSDDGAATSDANRVIYDSYCIASALNGTGSLDGAADWGSLDADGFTITIDDQFSTAIRVSYLALGGTDLSVIVGSDRQPSSTGNFSETGIGFQPKALIVAGAARTGLNSFAQGGVLSIGWATGTSAGQMGCVSIGVQDGQATSNTYHYGYNDELLEDAYSGSGSNRLELVSFDADGYTVNKIDGSDLNYFLYIALGGDAQFSVGELTTATDGSDISETVGFTPGALMFLSTCYAMNTADTFVDNACLSIGAGTSASNRAAQGVWDQDNLADMETCTANYDTAVYANVKDDAIVGLMDIKSIDASGFTCVMDDTDPAAYWVTYLAIGAAGGGATNITPAEATQAQASDAVTILAISPIVPAEATQAQLSDAASITAEGPTYPITAEEATQAQASDAASIVAIYPITPAEATQAQASDAATLTAIYLLTPGEATQAQTSDAATMGQFTPIAPAESTQAQASDAATITAIYPLVPAEATQAQASDAVTLAAIYPIAPAEATQSQISDAAVITGAGTYAITPAEATQAQLSDAATITAIYPITVSEATQSQTSDAAGITYYAPEAGITPAEATQAQLSDPVTLAVIYVLTVADATQVQISDLAVLSSPVTAYPPGNRRLLEPDERTTGAMAVRASSVFGVRQTLEVDD